MTPLPAVVGASVTTFAATNIDDIFLVAVFFGRRIAARRIVAGQYLGFAAIIVISLIGLKAAIAIPHHWIRILGFLPLTLGLKNLLGMRTSHVGESRASGSGVLSIAVITLSNGADNVAVYVPFFAVSRSYLELILLVYVALIAMLCVVGRWLGNHPLVSGPLDRWGHWAVPVVFIALGLYVLSS